MDKYILADVPGLISGAADGKGLGHKFLRHIRRTRLLVHLVSSELEDPITAYKTIRHELETFDEALCAQDEIIVFSKSDLAVDEEMFKKKIDALKAFNPNLVVVSIEDEASLKVLRETLHKALQ